LKHQPQQAQTQQPQTVQPIQQKQPEQRKPTAAVVPVQQSKEILLFFLFYCFILCLFFMFVFSLPI